MTQTHIALHVPDFDATIGFYERYCGMKVIHHRDEIKMKVVWMSEPGKEKSFIYVIMSGGSETENPPGNYSHFGFAVESEQRVNDIAETARKDGCLIWEPIREPWPVGYYCGVKDPAGNVVEFSFGQPLGPGAEDV